MFRAVLAWFCFWLALRCRCRSAVAGPWCCDGADHWLEAVVVLAQGGGAGALCHFHPCAAPLQPQQQRSGDNEDDSKRRADNTWVHGRMLGTDTHFSEVCKEMYSQLDC